MKKVYSEILEKKAINIDEDATSEQLRDMLENYGILLLVDFEYECDDTPYFYKIYRFKDNTTKEPTRVPIKGVHYLVDDDGNENEIEEVVGYRQWERSRKDFHTYKEALEWGLLEAVKKLPDIDEAQYTKCPYYVENGNCDEEYLLHGMKYKCNKRDDCPTLRKILNKK